MKPNYKNWVPKGMVYGLTAGTVILLVGLIISLVLTKNASMPVRISGSSTCNMNNGCLEEMNMPNLF